MHAVCRRIAGNDADALDATQEALIALVRGLPRYDGRAAFSTWAYRVATNACLDELRRRRRRPVPADDEALADARPDPGPAVADRVAFGLDVDAALQVLPEEFRAPVVLRDLEGLDYDTIAQVLDLPPGTVRSRISRGRRRLADLLDPPGPAEGAAGGAADTVALPREPARRPPSSDPGGNP